MCVSAAYTAVASMHLREQLRIIACTKRPVGIALSGLEMAYCFGNPHVGCRFDQS